jgi:glyoxylase-like metal-dependent hydrolase (beta-lactamase superfamily II)
LGGGGGGDPVVVFIGLHAGGVVEFPARIGVRVLATPKAREWIREDAGRADDDEAGDEDAAAGAHGAGETLRGAWSRQKAGVAS